MSKVLLLMCVLIVIFTKLCFAQTQCRTRFENREGTGWNITTPGENIIVGATAITVLRDDPKRCTAIIYNIASAGTIRCSSAPATPTATNGFVVEPGRGVVLESYEAVREMKCIRQGGTNGEVSVLEATE